MLKRHTSSFLAEIALQQCECWESSTTLNARSPSGGGLGAKGSRPAAPDVQ